MPQWSDDLYLGAAPTMVLGDNIGSSTNTTSPPNGGLGVGPMGRVYVFDVVPLTLQTNNIAASQTPGAAGNLTLTAGTGITSGLWTDGVTTVLTMDTPRTVRISSAGNEGVTIFTVSGYDRYGQATSEAITGLNGNTVEGKKAFWLIVTVAINAAAVGAITVGTGDSLGTPFRVLDVNHFLDVKWASALAQDAGTATAADTTSPATTTTGDVRGTYKPSSASNGSRRLTITLFMPAIASGPNATRVGALGVTQA